MIADIEPATLTFEAPSLVRDGEILARGVPIDDLVGTRGYVDMLFMQPQSRRPAEAERTMLDAYLVSL